MKRILLSVAIIVSITVISCKNEAKKEVETTKTEKTVAKVTYQCPMDCENGKTYNQPGSCPVCKMDLKKVTEDHAGHNH